MLINSFKHFLYGLVTILLTILAIPLLLIGELLYLLFTLSGMILGLPFIGFKYACKSLSEVTYLKVCSWENKYIYKLKEMNQFMNDEVNNEYREDV